MNGTQRLLVACAILTSAGCSSLPAAGPSAHQIEDATKHDELGAQLVPVTPKVVDVLSTTPNAAPAPVLPTGRPTDLIGPDDVLQITIYETGVGLFSSGLSPGSSQVTANATAAALPQVTVPLDGYIDVPYVGRVLAAGKTIEELREEIQRALGSLKIASQPQVVVTPVSTLSNSIYVSGDVKTPGRYFLTLTKEHLLDAIAMAGYANHLPYDSTVVVERGGVRQSVVLGDVQPGTPYDLALQSGDRILVVYDPRSFIVLGALARPAEVTFDTPKVTLAQALGRAGGLNDQQTYARGVYIFRRERPAVVSRLGLPATSAPSPVVYHFDMSDPGQMFLAQQFQMRNGDILYAADAPTESIHKVMATISGLFAPVAAAGGVASLAR